MNIRLLLLTTFGLGHMRPASGTWGSTPPPALALLMILILSGDGLSTVERWSINISLLLIALIFSIVCVRFGAEAEHRFGKKDPGQVVADETAGQAIALLFLPWRPMIDSEGWIWNVALAATAFFAFRILDIIKPPRLIRSSGSLVVGESSPTTSSRGSMRCSSRRELHVCCYRCRRWDKSSLRGSRR